MKWAQDQKDPLSLTISLICLPRKNVGMFFYNMVCRWLIPGKNLDIALSFSTNFKQDGREYTVSELVLSLECVQDLECAKRNLPFLEREILIGAKSFYHARRILEMKGLTLDDKTALIQEKVASFVRRFPKMFDYDIFNEMQSFLVSSKETFKGARQPAEISRIICTLYRFRKMLEQRIAQMEAKRHLCLKLKRAYLHTPFGSKEVLSIFIGLNFLNEHELFEERHVLSALSHFIPGIRSIPGSYYSIEDRNEQIHALYLEVEKESGSLFSPSEFSLLSRDLMAEVRKRIEQLVPPIFMPRNEEEVMRNILILSQQLKYLRDIPQMIISFDEQTDTELSFTVVIVRLLQPECTPITELFQSSPLAHNISFDRVKIVGRLRRKIPKEAAVFRVRLASENFMREDYSVDLFRARLHLVKKIEEIVGEVRDYNGGMISKQSENFLLLKKQMGRVASKHALLLQNFFHSIFPVQLSTTLDPHLLRILFSLLLETLRNPKESVTLKSKKASDFLFVMVKFQDFSLKQKIFNQLERLKLPSNELLTVQMQIFDSFYLGFIYLNPEKGKQRSFLEIIPEALSVPLRN